MYSKVTIIIMMIIFLLYTFVLLQISSIYIYTFKCAQLDRVGNQLFNLLNLGEQTQV